jgi:large subunit ribosomal protein L24e
MQNDSTFDFEQRRNRPIKYDRNVTSATIQAIQTISTIQQQRAQRFFDVRQQDALKQKKQQARLEIEQSIDILAPAVANRDKVMQNVVDTARARIAARSKKSMMRATTTNSSTTNGDMVEYR